MVQRKILNLALLQDVFPAPADYPRLGQRLAAAKEAGADLVVLPELPLDSWYPGHRNPKPEYVEEVGGPRQQTLSWAAKEYGVGLVGGALCRDEDGRRRNRALLFNAEGELLGHYDKAHLPAEEGFWEGDHYEASTVPPKPIDFEGFPVGLQICSDANRPIGTYLLAAAGALCVINPRATEAATFSRWRKVLQANAMVSALYVVSVNRPRPDSGVEFGGPAVVYDPDGEVVVESDDAMTLVQLDLQKAQEARRSYPGYLNWNQDLYREGWKRHAAKQ